MLMNETCSGDFECVIMQTQFFGTKMSYQNYADHCIIVHIFFLLSSTLFAIF